MKLDQILNGRIEQEIRDGMEALKTAFPSAKSRRIVVSVQSDGDGYVGATVISSAGRDMDSYGSSTIPDAVAVLAKKFTGPEAISEARQKIVEQIDALQAELSTLPN